MPGRRWNSTLYTSRPPANCRGARAAWDLLAKRDDGRNPKELCYTFADYWVWVMEFDDGEFDEVEPCVVRSILARSCK